MTFYNVISAVLFLGAIQQLLMAALLPGVAPLLMAGTVAILIFSDVVYTSHVVEGEALVKYRLPLMLIDLVNFFLLSGAIITLNPKSNIFSVDMTPLSKWFTEISFWFLLSAYWLLIMLWTKVAMIYSAGRLRSRFGAMLTVASVFVVEAALVWLGADALADWGRVVALVAAFGYLVVLERWWPAGDAREGTAKAA
jgi:hypothetical protein